ncbi:MAG: hypothetical protein KA371_19900 [Acidobacteria bacterium]|nr:hypothetical protein [Acidobacteriota bacterium]
MNHGHSLLVAREFVVALALLATGVPVAVAQPAPRPPAMAPPPPSDFMLGRPKVFLALDGGFLFARAGSDLYDFVTDQLTIEKRQFNTPVFGGRAGVAISPRLEIAVLYESARSQTASEYREFIDNQGLPITQTTLRQDHQIAATVRWSLLPSGRRISRFAWIPRTFTPFIGGGAGAIKYRFEQYGSFVDFETRRVFDDRFLSEGWAPSAHALAGADLRVYRKLYVTGEARYTWSSAPLGADFVDFEPIDLAGARLGAGLKLVF